MTIFESALRRAEEDPDGLAFRLYGRRHKTALSHRELLAGARRYQSRLRQEGVSRGDLVIVMLDHSPDQYRGFLGALLLGAIPSFMPPLSAKQDPALYWSSHATLFQRLKPRALIISSEREAELRRHIPSGGPSGGLSCITPEEAAAAPEDSSVATVGLDDVALLQHSSGTTQLKKGVQLTHRALLRHAAAYGAALKLQKNDRIASWLPLYHDMGLIACFITPLIHGVPVVALDPFEWVATPDLLLEVIDAERCTLTWLPNFAFHHQARMHRPGACHDLKSMRAWIDCSEPCRASTFDLFASTFSGSGVTPSTLQVCYAMAETVFAVAQTTVGTPPLRLRCDPKSLQSGSAVSVREAGEPGVELLSAGAPLPGLTVGIIDEAGRPLPEGHVGEITVTGEWLFAGYHLLPDKTAEKLVNGVYRTSDQGFLRQGELYVLGRLDDLIIVNGRNFSCPEIEHLVGTMPGIRPGRVAAFAVDDERAGTQAAVVMAESEEPDGPGSAALKRQIKESVFGQCDLTLREVGLVPAGWVIKTTSGKISRIENRAKYLREKEKRA